MPENHGVSRSPKKIRIDTGDEKCACAGPEEGCCLSVGKASPLCLIFCSDSYQDCIFRVISSYSQICKGELISSILDSRCFFGDVLTLIAVECTGSLRGRNIV